MLFKEICWEEAKRAVKTTGKADTGAAITWLSGRICAEGLPFLAVNLITAAMLPLWILLESIL